MLKDRRFPVTAESLRLFASERSAGKVVKTPFGDKTIELFTVEKARECDFVFLGGCVRASVGGMGVRPHSHCRP